MRIVDSVRYSDGDNTVLRFVVWKLWKYQCYWCRKPTDFTDTQLDHIIPKSVDDVRLDHLLREFSLPGDFDLDDPGNLGPICATCNGRSGKGSQDLSEVPAVRTQLRKAANLRPDVVKQVQSFRSNGRLAQNLLRVIEADLDDDAARKLFEEHAPAIVQRLALLGEEKADFLTYRTEAVDLDYDVPLDVDVSLDSQARTAVVVLTEVCGCPLDEFLCELVSDLLRKVRRRVQDDFERIEGPAGPTNSGEPVENFIRVTIDSIDFDNDAGTIDFTFGGTFKAMLAAGLIQDSTDGSELKELQGDAQVSGTFAFVATLDPSIDHGEMKAGECWIESWEEDVWVLR